MNDVEFWQSRFFWKAARITIIILSIVFIIVSGIICEERLEWEKDQFKYKKYLFHAPAGQKVDEKEAWPNHVWAVKSGYFIRDKHKKGIELDELIKEVKQLRADVQLKATNRRESYKQYLRENYKVEENVFHLVDEWRWQEIENNKEDLKVLKGILAGDALHLKEPDFGLKVTKFEIILAFAGFLVIQFLAYLFGFTFFKDSYYSNYLCYYKLKEAKLNIVAFLIFVPFVPGALIIIVIQLFNIAKHQIPEYMAERRERKDALPVLKTVEVDTDASAELLRRLEERLNKNEQQR